MSIDTATESAPAIPRRGKVTFTGVMRSELIRFFSLNSTRILILVAFVVYVGVALMGVYGVGMLRENMGAMAQMPGMGPFSEPGFVAETMGSGVMFSQLILGVLGVLLFSGEFTTGSAVSTFLASPQRLRVFGAKLLIIVVLTGIVQLISTLVAYLVCRPIAQNFNMSLDFGTQAFQAVLWYGTLAVIMAAVMGLSFGVMLRNSAGGITSLVALFFVLPMIAQILLVVTDWFADVARFMPDQLGLGLAMPLSYPSTLETWAQILGVCAWILVPVLLGAFLLKTRDIK